MLNNYCNDKIKSLEELRAIIAAKKLEGKRITHCHGVFDLMHIGHIHHFVEAKSKGDLLIVTITPDEYVDKGPGRPAFSQTHRAQTVAALGVVDFVAINKWATAVNTIKFLEPDIYVKGPDYHNSENDITGNILIEEDAIKHIGGEVYYTNGIIFSSSNLLNEYLPQLSEPQLNYLTMIKNQYSLEEINIQIDSIKNLRVVVIGETIIDEYQYCNALGKSGKEPVLVMQKTHTEMYAGGALAVANHIADFCNQVNILSYLGQDSEYLNFVKDNLKENIRYHYVNKSNSPTIVKTRIIDSYSKSKQLGIYEINDELLSKREENKFCSIAEEIISEADVVIVCDYCHGLITPQIGDFIIEKSKYLAINTQQNAANIGFHRISKYSKADYVCIHEGELRQEFRSRTKDIRDLIIMLSNKLQIKNIVITRGDKGSISYNEEGEFLECPAYATNIVDRIGAGDTFLAMTSLCFSSGIFADLTLFLGNLSTSQVLSVMGNSKSLSKTSLLRAVKALLK